MKADRGAATALEYGLVAGVIVAVIALGFTSFADSLSSQFTSLGGNL